MANSEYTENIYNDGDDTYNKTIMYLIKNIQKFVDRFNKYEYPEWIKHNRLYD